MKPPSPTCPAEKLAAEIRALRERKGKAAESLELRPKLPGGGGKPAYGLAEERMIAEPFVKRFK